MENLTLNLLFLKFLRQNYYWFILLLFFGRFTIIKDIHIPNLTLTFNDYSSINFSKVIIFLILFIIG